MDCYLCHNFFPNVDNLLQHIQVEHGVPSIANFKCTACKPTTIFKDVHRFKRHITSRHFSPFQTSSACVQKHPEDGVDIIATHQPESCDVTEVLSSKAIEDDHATRDNTVDDNDNDRPLKCKEEEILEIRSRLREFFLSFTISLLSKKNLTRKDAIELQHNITEDIVVPILDAISKIADIREDPMNAELLSDLRDPFNFICTEYRLNTQLENLNMLEVPQEIQYKDEEGNVVSKGCLAPIKFQLKKFFETSSMLEQTMHNMTRLEQTNDISNVVNGTLWKAIKPMYGEQLVIPLFLYSDEAELNDAIGAHSGTHKVCGLYYSLPTIPSHYLSRLSCIFIAGFVKATDIAERGPSTALKDLVNILIELEKDGIELNIENKSVRVYFVLMAILGDNLGINQLMGYVTSFNSLLYCRFCTLNKNECKTTVILDPNLIRNKENYAIDLTKSSKESGIKEECGFNRLQHYHAGDFVAVDVMHDFFSHGICAYDLTLVFEHMIKTLRISLSIINYRIKMFDYGRTEKQKTIKTITHQQIKLSSYKMTAREMMLLVRYFPLIFGDLIPQHDKVWNFMMSLVELVDIVLLPRFNNEMLSILHEQIMYHHTHYQQLFGAKLKPKFHILLHYVDVIKKVGPPRYTWSFRFEAMHQMFKQYSRNITSRKNICRTLCIKANLFFMQNMINMGETKQNISYKNALHIKINELPYYNAISSRENLISDAFYICKVATYKGTEYKIGDFVTKSEHNMRRIELYEIKDLLVFENELLLVCKEWYVGDYSYHFASIEVHEIQTLFEICNVSLFDGPPIHVYNVDVRKFIRLKKFFV